MGKIHNDTLEYILDPLTTHDTAALVAAVRRIEGMSGDDPALQAIAAMLIRALSMTSAEWQNMAEQAELDNED